MKCPYCGSNRILFVREEIVSTYYTVIGEKILWDTRLQEDNIKLKEVGYECQYCKEMLDVYDLIPE